VEKIHPICYVQSKAKNNPAGFGRQEKNPQNLKPIYPAGLIYFLYSKTGSPCNTKKFLSKKNILY
jgi:hypothetical protein